MAGVLAGVAALLSFAFGIYQYRAKRRQESLAEIIYKKATAAAAAVRIRNLKKYSYPNLKKFRFRGLKKIHIRSLKKVNIRFIKRRRRRQELQALCLATVFERSGRTRSLIHDALKAQQVNHPDEIRNIIDQITVVIGRNASYTDLTRAGGAFLISLRSALSLDGDTRTRIDAIEIYTGAARRTVRLLVAASTKHIAGSKSDNPCCCLGSSLLVCPSTGEGQSESIRSDPWSAHHHSRLSPNWGGQTFLTQPDAGQRKVR